MSNSGGNYKAPLSGITNKINFYPTVIDNFFDNPDLIRKFALSLSYEKDSDGYWPGERSDQLYNIDNELNNAIILKIFSLYYDLKYNDVQWQSSSISFQKIKPYHKSKDHKFNKGWIHKDEDYDFAGLVYLNPKPDLDSGTSLFKIKDNVDEVTYERHYEKHRLFSGDKKLDEKSYNKNYDLHNNKFIETVRFQNLYNRLVCYDSNYYHRANSYSTSDDRLTMVFFINGIKVERYPMDRVKRFGNENYINDVTRKLTTK